MNGRGRQINGGDACCRCVQLLIRNLLGLWTLCKLGLAIPSSVHDVFVTCPTVASLELVSVVNVDHSRKSEISHKDNMNDQELEEHILG